MCGRFTITATDAADVAEALATEFSVQLRAEAREQLRRLHRPRYNAAPGDRHWVLSSRHRPVAASWGLMNKAGRLAINARAESISQGHYSAAAITQGRCAVVVDGFYEWGGTPRGPWHITKAGGAELEGQALGTLTLAAIARRDSGGEARFAIVTCPPAEAVRAIHDRMPLVLDRAALGCWLDPSTDATTALEVVARPSGLGLHARRVGPHVNDPRHDDPRCLHADAQGLLFS